MTGDLRLAKKLGIYALTLDICAIVMAFVVAVAFIITLLSLASTGDNDVVYGCWYMYDYVDYGSGGDRAVMICS